MADKLNLGNGEVRELKIGQSFTNPKSTSFHTLKYDFKPASVDKNKIASVDVGSNHQVTVTVPHLDGAGIPQTVFKGSQRPYQKECVLIIDRVTGEITLEKLACNIQVKKTRSESAKPSLSIDRTSTSNDTSSSLLSGPRSQSPSVGTRNHNRTKVTSGARRGADRQITHLVPKHSPLHASPNYPSPHHNKSPKEKSNNHEVHNPNALASLPMIGLDDFCDPPPPPVVQAPPPPPPQQIQSHLSMNKTSPSLPPLHADEIGEITDTSSSSSDSDSDSDHNVTMREKPRSTNGHSSGHSSHNGSGYSAPPAPSVPSHLLNEDLCLSESGSDSD